MTDPFTIDDLRAFLEHTDGDRNVHFYASGAIHDCVGAKVEDIEWNNGRIEPAIILGARGSNVDDPRSDE